MPASPAARLAKPVRVAKPARLGKLARTAPARKPRGSAEEEGGRSNLRNPEKTIAAILAAAVREFAEHGFGGARIDRIADRSGSNKRMIYHYFGHKEALYIAVLESAYLHIRSAEHGLHLEQDDPIAAIEKLVQFTWTYFLQHPEFLSLLGTENLLKAKYLKRSARIFNLHTPLVSLLSRVIARGVRSKQLRKDLDPVKLYITIASLGFFYLADRWTLSTIFRRDLMADRELRGWGRHICDVVISYVRA